jgi:hypothetical protein
MLSLYKMNGLGVVIMLGIITIRKSKLEKAEKNTNI